MVGSVTEIPLDKSTIDNCLSVWVLDDVLEINKAISEISREICKKYDLELVEYKSFAGDLANIGFSLILFSRVFWGMLRIDKYMRPIYSFFINVIFRPLDKFFRIKKFKGRFEINSLGYFYIFSNFARNFISAKFWIPRRFDFSGNKIHFGNYRQPVCFFEAGSVIRTNFNARRFGRIIIRLFIQKKSFSADVSFPVRL